MQSLPGKIALVTGGAHRIGRAIALALAQAGADVAISFHRSQTAAAQTAAEIAAFGRRALAIPCDVRSENSVRAAVASVAAEFGRIDILVNNAGVFASAALESLTLDQWDLVLDTNTRGPFLVAREALPHLRAVRGRIINIGSLGATHAWAGHAHYCASKAALHMLTQAMAKAFAPDVSVNCVAPGWIELAPLSSTEVAPSSSVAQADERVGPESAHSSVSASETRRFEAQAARFAAKTPMGRNGSAGEVAQAVLFFAAGPHFITGQTLAVDGGLGLL
jgi:NAD(P)-dependent dehydrogenase (short-subunit alcohol dehydrogenase family)